MAPQASVRCVRTIKPAPSEPELTARAVIDAQRTLGIGEPIVVDLDGRDATTEAASILARLADDGHYVDVRGEGGVERQLRDLIEAFREGGCRDAWPAVSS